MLSRKVSIFKEEWTLRAFMLQPENTIMTSALDLSLLTLKIEHILNAVVPTVVVGIIWLARSFNTKTPNHWIIDSSKSLKPILSVITDLHIFTNIPWAYSIHSTTENTFGLMRSDMSLSMHPGCKHQHNSVSLLLSCNHRVLPHPVKPTVSLWPS